MRAVWKIASVDLRYLKSAETTQVSAFKSTTPNTPIYKIYERMIDIDKRDIVERNGIEREDILNDILDFLASQISSLTNPTNIANTLSSMKNEKINSPLVTNYVQYIIDSFLISMAKR